MKLTDLEYKTVSIAMWDTAGDLDNGNGARAYIKDGFMTLEGECGWDYIVTADETDHIAFDADEVHDITTEADGSKTIRIVHTDSAVIFFLAYAAHDLCILDEGDERYSQIYTRSIEVLADALPADERKFLLKWLDDDDKCLLTDYFETLMNTYDVGGYC